MFVHIIAFTQNGATLCSRLAGQMAPDSAGYAPTKYCVAPDLTPLTSTAGEWTAQHFNSKDALVFVGATGIAVRCIAPLVADKGIDPAVLCVDEKGEHVIPLLSGHIGGANALAHRIAGLLGAKAVITTATDVQQVFAVDTWAAQSGCFIPDTSHIKTISAHLLDGGSVGLASDFPIAGTLPSGIVESEDFPCGVLISLKNRQPYFKTLQLIPRCLRVGIGCRKDVEYAKLGKFLLRVLEEHRLPVQALECIATISLKEREPALLELSQRYALPLETYTPQQLAQVEGDFASSDFVHGVTGVDNVCERAAMFLGGVLLVPKTVSEGITIAVTQREWRVVF